MIRRQQLSHDLDGLADAIPISAGGIHGEDFHPLLDRVLTRGQQLALGGAFPAFLAVNLDHT